MESTRRYAGAPSRCAAIVLDLLVLSTVFFAVTRVVKGTWVMSPADHRWARGWFVTDPLCVVFLAVMFLYFVLFEGFLGATPGKRAVGLRVVNADGQPPGLGRSVLRNALRVVDGLPVLGILAVVLIASSRDRTRLGDRAAKTWVVHARTGGP